VTPKIDAFDEILDSINDIMRHCGRSPDLGVNHGDSQRTRYFSSHAYYNIHTGGRHDSHSKNLQSVEKQADAFVAAWLPGTEGQGVADGLFGDQPFTGKLPFTWPKSMDQLPFNLSSPAAGAKAPLFPFGYGLTK